VSNVSVTVTANTVTSNDQFGSTTAISSNGRWLYAGNPGNKSVQVFANVDYEFSTAQTISNINASFGSSFDTQANLLAIGAPTAGNVHVYYNNNGTHTKLQMLHSANASGKFGANIAMSADGHWLYVNEPTVSQVQAYYTSNVASAASYTLVSSLTVAATAIKTNANGTRLFVGASNDTNGVIGNGNLYVYSRTANAFTLGQTLTSQYKNINAGFGASLAIDSTAGNLFVGIPNSLASGNANGLVERYTYNGTSYVFKESIVHPDAQVGQFGSSLSITGDAVVLAVVVPVVPQTKIQHLTAMHYQLMLEQHTLLTKCLTAAQYICLNQLLIKQLPMTWARILILMTYLLKLTLATNLGQALQLPEML